VSGSTNPVGRPEGAGGTARGVAYAVNVNPGSSVDDLLAALEFQLRAQGYIPMFKPLTLACGGPKPALFVAFLTNMTVAMHKRRPERKGWIYMTADEIWKIIGLSPDEQKGARRDLLKLGLIEERRTYNPSRLHFRVNQVGLARALELDKEFAGNDTPVDDTNPWGLGESPFTRLLGGQHLFFAPLARLVDDVVAAIVLGNLIEQLRAALRARQCDWGSFFAASWDRLLEEIGLSPKQIRHARDRLRRMGFVREQVRGKGTHARVHVWIGLQQILACLQAQERAPLTARLETRAVERRIASSQQSRSPVGAQLAGSPKASALLDQALAALSSDFAPSTGTQQGSLFPVAIREPSDALDRVLDTLPDAWCPNPDLLGAQNTGSYTYNEVLHNSPTTDALVVTAVDNSDDGSSSRVDAKAIPKHGRPAEDDPLLEELIYPSHFQPAALRPVIARARQDRRQLLLDELIGASKHKTIESPVGWLHRVVELDAAGNFNPAYAFDVQAARVANAAHEQRLHAATQPPTNHEELSPAEAEASRARGEESRARLRELRREMVARSDWDKP
jgi:hypothetical protein